MEDMDTSDGSDPLLSEFTGWQVDYTCYIVTQTINVESVIMLGRVHRFVRKVKNKNNVILSEVLNTGQAMS